MSALDEALAGRAITTIAKRVTISKTIIDAQFVHASPMALEMYGVNEIGELGWLSHTQHIKDYRHTLQLSVCRHFGAAIPTTYRHRIITRNGADITVVKHTRELVFQGEIFWITNIEESTDKAIPLLNDIAVPESISEHSDFGGMFSVAEIEGILLHTGRINRDQVIYPHIDELIDEFSG